MSKINPNICRLFLEKAEQMPDKTAIIDKKGNRISFSLLAEDVKKSAAHLKEEGIRKGDRVLILVPISPALYRNVLALIYLGAVPVFIDQWAGWRRMRRAARVADCKAFISNKKLRLFAAISGLSKGTALSSSKTSRDFKSLPALAECQSDDAAIITFSSGTSGQPKGAIRTHGILNEQFHALSEIIQPETNEIDCSNLPVIILLNLASGKTSVIPPELKEPSKLTAELLKDNSVNTLSCSPAFSASLSRSDSSFRKLFIGGASVFKEDLQKLMKAWPMAEITVVYGSSEAEPVSFYKASEHINMSKERGLFVGQIHHAAKVIIVPENHTQHVEQNDVSEFALPHYKPGEICVSGKHVVNNYLNNREADIRNKIRNGVVLWHRTGDIGYTDDKGNLFLMGRKQYCEVIGDTSYYPVVIEKIARSYAGVEFSAFIIKNKKAVLVIESREVEKKVLQAMLNDAGYELEVVRVKKIPRDPRHNSRPDYEKLKRKLWI